MTSPCCSGCHDVAATLVASLDKMMRPRQRQNSINEDEAFPKRLLRGDPFSMVGKPLSTSFDAGVPLLDVQEAASHADPRTTMRYDKARELHQTSEVCEVCLARTAGKCPSAQQQRQRFDQELRSNEPA